MCLGTLLNVVSGVCHKYVRCDACDERYVRGSRWKCAVCYNYNLCHKCYMSNRHYLWHEFIRIDFGTLRYERKTSLLPCALW